MEKAKLLIVGDGETAEMAYEYFSTDYEIQAFLVEKKFTTKTELFGLPIFPLEDIRSQFPKDQYKVFVAISYVNANKLRERLFDHLLNLGYQFVSYVHPSVQLGVGAEIGVNCFILENVVIQRKVKIGNNVFMWSGSVVAHRSVIKDHVFMATGVMISGFCEVGKRCFLGVGSKLMDYIKIADDCIIGGGAFVNRNAVNQNTYVGVPAKEIKR